jgi:hypothetical protein
VAAQFRDELQQFPIQFPTTKNNIRERTQNTQQHQASPASGLDPGAARISRNNVFSFSSSSSSLLAHLSKGGGDLWKTVRVSMSVGVT